MTAKNPVPSAANSGGVSMGAKGGAGHDQASAPRSKEAVKAPDNEEPEPVPEADLSTDGPDEQGEAMIRDLPRNPQLSPPLHGDADGERTASAEAAGRQSHTATTRTEGVPDDAPTTPLEESLQAPQAAEDENQPGFLGDRNRPHP
jgi:hypothetical protein